MTHFTIRTLHKTDILDVKEIGRMNKFFYSSENLLSLMKRDPNGIKVAVTPSGKVAAVCAFVKHNEDICFVGAFCVKEEFRSMGLGSKLWNSLILHAGDKNIGLNCETHLINYYKRLGLTISEDAWSVLEYSRYSPVNPESLRDEVPGVDIRNLEESNFQILLDYDYTTVGYKRRAVLEANCKEATAKTLIAFKNDKCVGFGTVKRNIFDAAHVGPLYAENPDIAEVILKKLLELMPTAKGMAMGTIVTNYEANEFLKRLGVPIHLHLFRQYSKEKMKVNTDKVFALFSVDFSPF